MKKKTPPKRMPAAMQSFARRTRPRPENAERPGLNPGERVIGGASAAASGKGARVPVGLAPAAPAACCAGADEVGAAPLAKGPAVPPAAPLATGTGGLVPPVAGAPEAKGGVDGGGFPVFPGPGLKRNCTGNAIDGAFGISPSGA